MTDKELIVYLHDFKGKHTLEQLSVATGMTIYEVQKVVRANGLKHLLYNPLPDIILFVGDAPVDTITINQVAEKFGLTYVKASTLLKKCGMMEKIHKRWGVSLNRDRVLESDLVDMLQEMTINQVAEINRIRDQRPYSRTALYEFCRTSGIKPLTVAGVKEINRKKILGGKCKR